MGLNKGIVPVFLSLSPPTYFFNCHLQTSHHPPMGTPVSNKCFLLHAFWFCFLIVSDLTYTPEPNFIPGQGSSKECLSWPPSRDKTQDQIEKKKKITTWNGRSGTLIIY